MYKVSVIVPVYNVEKYLNKCIKSLLDQDFENYEIILIDDGSTDNSGRICDSYSSNYGNISVYHKKNGGLSDSRNYGIEKSSANYITFVDSDDYVTTDYISTLYELIHNNDADMSACSTFMTSEKNLKRTYKEYNVKKIDSSEMLKVIFIKEYGIGVSTWAKMYKKSLFDNIKFPVNKIHEDLLTTPFIVDKCRKIMITNVAKYYYNVRENSITTREINLSRDKQLFDGLNKIKKFILLKYPTLIDEFNCRYLNDAYQFIDRVVTSNQFSISQKKRIINNIILDDENLWKQANKNKYLSLRRKIYIEVTRLNPVIYIYLHNIKMKIKLFVNNNFN